MYFRLKIIIMIMSFNFLSCCMVTLGFEGLLSLPDNRYKNIYHASWTRTVTKTVTGDSLKGTLTVFCVCVFCNFASVTECIVLTCSYEA